MSSRNEGGRREGGGGFRKVEGKRVQAASLNQDLGKIKGVVIGRKVVWKFLLITNGGWGGGLEK